MNPSPKTALKESTRRQLFETCGVGLGKISLATLMASQPGVFTSRADANEITGGALGGLHHPAKVKRVIYLFMAGAPSQLDLFDNKPELTRLEGQPIPPSVIDGQRYAFIQPDAAVLSPSDSNSRKHGQSAAQRSPGCRFHKLAEVVDDIAIMQKCAHGSVQPLARTDLCQYGKRDSWSTRDGFVAQLRNRK